MSDNLNIQAESWRGPRRRSGQMDPQMVRMAIMAAGVLGVVALGAGGYALISHRPHGIPVVEADSRPIRVRPDNPGGTIVEGANEEIMGGGRKTQADAMAPAAEAPAPQALRAQIAAAHPAPLPPIAVPALEPAAPVMPAQKVSLAAPPAPAPSAVSELPETRPAAKRPADAVGGTQVQLAAMESEQAAMTEWQAAEQADAGSARCPPPGGAARRA